MNNNSNSSDHKQFGSIHRTMITRQPCSDQEDFCEEQQLHDPENPVRKRFWYDLDLDGFVQGEAISEKRKVKRKNNQKNYMMARDENMMDVEGSDYQFMERFGHFDVHGLYPQNDLNYGSSLQRLFGERNQNDGDYHHQQKSYNKKQLHKNQNHPARKCSLAFLSENKEQEDDFGQNYPPSDLPLFAKENSYFQQQNYQPPKFESGYSSFNQAKSNNNRFLNLIEDQTTLNLCIQQVKENLGLNDANYRQYLKNQHSLESLSGMFSKALTQILVSKSQYSPSTSINNFTPNSIKPAEPPIMVSDYELESQAQVFNTPSIQKNSFIDKKSTVTSNTLNNRSIFVTGSKWTKDEVSYLQKILEQHLNNCNQIRQQNPETMNIDWNGIAKIFGRSMLQVFKKGKTILLKLENKLFNKKTNSKTASKQQAKLSKANNALRTTQDQINIRSQLSNEALIHLAIQRIPSKCGTKIEIFQQIKDLQNEMNIPERRESSLQQTLSTKFKKIPGTFSLTKLGADNAIKSKQAVIEMSMKMKVLYILSYKTDYTATLQQIKESIILDFENNLNCNSASEQLSVWETTLLKVLTTNKAEIDNSRSKGLYTFFPKYSSSMQSIKQVDSQQQQMMISSVYESEL